MDDFKLTHLFITKNPLINIEKSLITKHFNETDGIVLIEIVSNEITLVFYKHTYTVDFIKKKQMTLDNPLLKQKEKIVTTMRLNIIKSNNHVE